jgi:hypothetical protein
VSVRFRLVELALETLEEIPHHASRDSFHEPLPTPLSVPPVWKDIVEATRVASPSSTSSKRASPLTQPSVPFASPLS